MSNTELKAYSAPGFDNRAMVARIRELYGAANDTELARQLGKPRATVAAWSGRNIIPLNILVGICKEKNASLDCIVLGKNASDTLSSFAVDHELLHKVIEYMFSRKHMREDAKEIPGYISAIYGQCARAVYGANPSRTREQLLAQLSDAIDRENALPFK